MRDEEHADYRNRLAAYSAGELDGVEWVWMRTHLAQCLDCRSRMSQPVVWNRAMPQRIAPRPDAEDDWFEVVEPAGPPGWLTVAATAVVVALVASGVGYALGASGGF